jgi:hypothetical protein
MPSLPQADPELYYRYLLPCCILFQKIEEKKQQHNTTLLVLYCLLYCYRLFLLTIVTQVRGCFNNSTASGFHCV